MDTRRTWLVLSLGASERQHAGNTGYDDELERVYRYDSFVQNSRQLQEEDVLILCNRKDVLGVARASRIVSFSKPKSLSRCPECRSTSIKARKELSPRYKCKAGHEFDEPQVTEKPCVHFEAHFDEAFRAVPPGMPAEGVRQACLKYTGQLAMQQIDLERLQGPTSALRLLVTSLLEEHRGIELAVNDASEAEDGYAPDGHDARQVIARQIRARRGQAAFRQALRKRFDDTCIVTGCRLPDLLEAAHISPYRGEKDHHLSNGLLLRADVHTLFDLDLLGIEPDTFQIRTHPRLKGLEYESLDGKRLACPPEALSRPALEQRWRRFQQGLKARQSLSVN